MSYEDAYKTILNKVVEAIGEIHDLLEGCEEYFDLRIFGSLHDEILELVEEL